MINNGRSIFNIYIKTDTDNRSECWIVMGFMDRQDVRSFMKRPVMSLLRLSL